MGALGKRQMGIARRIWVVQRRHRNIKFNGRDFTSTGKLSPTGKRKIRK